MAILQGIKLKNDETVHQLDWEKGIANKPKPIQSDYSQNDETALDFIKNRPFHDNVDGREIIVKKQNLALTENDKSTGSNPMDYCYLQFNVASNPLNLRFVEGEKLIYIWNDTEYECETKCEYDETNEVGIYRIGNQNIMYSDAEDTGEPFLIAQLKVDGYSLIQISSRSNSATLEIQKDIKTVKYLDSKYIKDMYGEVNKVEEILPLQPLELSLEGQEEYGTFIPTTIDYEIKIGDYITVTYEGIEYNCETFDISQIIGADFEVPVIGNLSGDSIEPFYMLFDTTGALSGEGQIIAIMDTTPPQEGVETITREVGIKYNVHKINYINPKYIENMYYSEDGEYETIFERTSVTCELDSISNAYQNTMPKSFEINVGKKYKVIFDDIEYICVGATIEGSKYIGNLNCLSSNFPSNGEPFLIGNNNITMFVNCYDDNEHTISIEEQNEIIHQVPSKYVNAYTKEEIDTMFGTYVTEVDTLLGGE